MNANLQLSPQSADALVHYAWRGNVRELRNVAEFLASKGKKYIELDDLPPMKYRQKEHADSSLVQESSTIIDKFILNEGREIELYYAVLCELRRSFGCNERYGRQKLLEKVNESGGVYTEGEVRKALSKLASYGFIRSPKGRGGSVINHEGIRLLEVIETFRERGILG